MTSAAAMQRIRGGAVLGFGASAGHTRLRRHEEWGAMRVRLPRPYAAGVPEPVLINTGGGLTGGDRLELDLALAPGGRAWVTTQACEKIYRSTGDTARLRVRAAVADDAELVWLPQPTILFEGSAFERRIDVDLGPRARLFAVEATVLGRAAMGETVRRCRLLERWRVRRDGTLLWAAENALAQPERQGRFASTLEAGRALATFVRVAPDAEDELERWRHLGTALHGRAGFGAQPERVIGVLVAPDADALMDDLRMLVEGFFERPVPRVWTC